MDGSARIAAVEAEVGQVLHEGLQALAERVQGMDLGSIEALVQALGRRLLAPVVEHLAARAVVAAEDARPPVCATCGGSMRRVGRRVRRLLGLTCDVRLARWYYHCAGCGTGCAPADAVWGLDSGALTPGLARVAARDGLEAPFGQSASLLAEHLGVFVGEEVIRSVTEGLGQLADADQAVAPPDAAAASPQAPGRRRGTAPQPAVDTLVVELDGGMVHLRQAWSELKAGRVAPLGPKVLADPDSGDRYLALGSSCYCAGVESCDVFWPRLRREAVRAGLGRTIWRVVVLADGAAWIWHQARCQLRLPGVEVVEILDFYHASEHLGAVADAVYGGKTDLRQQWLARQCHALRHQGPAPVLAALDRLHPRKPATAKLVQLTRDYLATHAARLDYPTFRARLFPIGSGAIEGTVKNLIQMRQVQAGMRWSQPGAHAVANLRALHRSTGRWHRFWQSRPLCRAATQNRAPVAVSIATAPALAASPPRQAPAPAAAPPAAPHAELPSPTAPRCHTRMQTDGKPWGKGKGYWGRVPICPKQSA
jgi:hypothetical protein